ncbi:alpha-2-macroglobulin family protein [Marinirhabdus gelatinilytica]|uniref:Alpha-2-macroglobulin family protein n=1 Tax=Marinirhabdus gelatinilytica TaxID=1703343 RepID=A0A370Q7E0_9FLAO|nr:carboxypeptidase-like regulatory domain-containing protein [Marinirhabdus gelatinilytica]RDK84257.1 alpha-2-macroglobulin family protein [Marinirhabdus gelatinilytica]
MKTITTLIIALFAMTLTNAQNTNYNVLWNKVEQFEIDDLPKSALEIVQQIETKAKTENNQAQLIKTLLFKSKFALVLEENSQLKVVNDFRTEISKTNAPAKNVLQNMLAKLYWDYFQANRYQFYNRTKTANKVDETDFRTWDLETLFAEISKYYQASLNNKETLQNTTTEAFEPILNTYKGSNKIRPTLYDFLAHNALEFYKTSENSITKPTYAFEVNNASYLEGFQKFQQLEIASKDTISLELKALRLYQDLIEFHSAKNNTVPLAAVDVERLSFVKSNGTIPEKEAVYLSALQHGKQKVSAPYAKALYNFAIAEGIYEKGNSYVAGENETDRWAHKEALEICERLITTFPDTYIAVQAKNLKQTITSPLLQVQLEAFLPIHSDSRMLVTYKNSPSVQLWVYEISAKQSEQLQRIYDKEKKRDFIEKLSLQKQWTQQLRDEGDYRQHSTEILLPGFPQGHYLVLATPTNTENKRLFEVAEIQYTNLALVQTQDKKYSYYQVVDRNNGQPIANANCIVRDDRKKYRKSYTSDTKGFIKVPKYNRNYYNFSVTVEKGDDTAVFSNYYNYNRYYDDDENPYKSYLFTDRSIYRPGQTVYFKAIIVKAEKEKAAVAPNESLTATLYDANGDEQGELKLKTTEFGTVAGEFVVPTGVLTGQFHIEIASNTPKKYFQDFYFRVEEYKRPKFETNFKPVPETYRVNDSITVKGEAVSFSGSNITNAKVTYKVTRKVQYPRWWYWGRSYNMGEGQEITFGETTTNNKGEYEIDFKALPDGTVDKDGQPIFQYEVTADVTDINGETQSTKTIVNVGYHALTIGLQVPQRLDKQNKKEKIEITTKNLNGEKVSATVTLKIYKLKAPETVFCKRPWNAPDYQEYSKEQFKKLFPHDPYNNEDNIQNWERGEEVFSTTIDSENVDELELGNLKRWASGAYVVVATTQEKFGQEVKAKSYTKVFSNKDKTPANNALFDISLDKETYAPGDTALVTVKSNAAITVTLSVEKQHQITQTFVLALDSNSKTISIPVTAEDIGGFVVHRSLTAFNSFEGSVHYISVPAPKTELTIETNTFRDKLEPGVPETWSFTIKGPKGEKVSAELLASMYDLSLDQFAPHAWSFKPQPSLRYRPISNPSASQSFGNRAIYLEREYRNYYHTNPQRFDQFNWFGLDFSGQTWRYNRYKNSLRQKIKESYSSTVKDGFIRGTIYDENGLPIPGVNVVVKGTQRGTQSDFDGNFEIKAEKGEELVFSYIGYKEESLKLKKNNVLDIHLWESGSNLDEVIVTAQGIPREKKALGYAVSEVSADAIEEEIAAPLDGVAGGLKMEDEEESNVAQKEPDFSTVKIRKNLQETAFFYPQLRTDKDGTISFNFTTPEALTRWKVQLLAHTKDLNSQVSTFETVTQKELMVVPNAPRFLREGDEIIISAKISNLSDSKLTGKIVLQLEDAITTASINRFFNKGERIKEFSVGKNENTEVSWRLQIPSDYAAVQYKIIAKTNNFSDGEQNTLPILSNRMLVTETQPMWVRSNQTKTFTLDKLKNNTSTTLKHHKLTLEITSNPAWYAVQALPYLMEFPYECNEQTFARYYANTLATHIANSNPRIKAVFDQWSNSDALLSNLEKNEELKSLLVQETPWLRDAQSEAEQKKRIALLFDLNLMQRKQQEAVMKLQQNQLGSGAWPWFNGGYANRYITQHIATGFGHLKALEIDPSTSLRVTHEKMIEKAVSYLDTEFVKEYRRLSQYTQKPDYSKDHLSRMQTHYLYMRSFFPELQKSKEVEKISDYYLGQMETYWNTRDLYSKGMIALVLHRNGKTATASKITKSLKETSITSEELGMYWKSNTPSWYWYQAPIETQALMVEVFSEIEKDTETIDHLKVWLLKNKQTNQWRTTKATTEAVYALLLQGTDWLSVTEAVQVTVGNQVIDPSTMDNIKVEAGTGYFKTSWNTTQIEEEMATVTMQKKGEGIAWGGMYWQYFEDLDKITHAETPLQLQKKLFLKKNTATGEELSAITESTALQVGDLVRVRIELRTDREMDFVHMKDMRAAGLEPIDVLSTYKWQDGLGYYQATKDASTNFFFDTLQKGVYVFEYDLRVNNAGDFSNGITTIQSMYAPEFTSHSEGIRISVGNE